jgi:hypothetical protein
LGAAEGYKKVLLLLCQHSGVDLSRYKSTTIQRRIDRRVILTKHGGLAEYAGFLRGNTKELDARCDTVLSGASVGVADVTHDPRYPLFAEFAMQCGIRAGWNSLLGCSTPVKPGKKSQG